MMKRLYLSIITLILTQFAFAQWPANYDGVMLQAFYWDSFEDTKWTNLTSQAPELGKYFDLVWVPNSANCVSSNSMGYLPVYWFDHRSSFGARERYLTEMISAFHANGVKVIEDVVINHKSPKGAGGSWIDFANEEGIIGAVTGATYSVTWSGADICQNDDGGDVKNHGWPVTGANDTGEDFSGARDLDHTSENVQKNCISYMNYLLKELQYDGFRLDMVKGYHPQYTKMYNEAVKPQFCVGEYWDGTDAIKWWISNTGWTSAAFDFPLKFKLKSAISDGNWSELDDKSITGSNEYQRYSVTFIDNHDTYRDENGERMRSKVLAGNAAILALPGTPCIFLKHWKRYPIAIGNMILARKAAGVHNQSSITDQYKTGNGYVIKTSGTKGDVLCLLGDATYDTSGFNLIASGEGFSFYVGKNVTVSGLRQGTDSNGEVVEPRDITIYVKATGNGAPAAEDAPYLYMWNENGQPNGGWPGKQMTEYTEIDGQTFWKQTINDISVNIVINNGVDVQTKDITGLTHDSYFTFDENNSDKETNSIDLTSQYYKGTTAPITLPSFVKPIEGHLYAYFRGNLDFDSPYAYAWKGDKVFTGSGWPGVSMTKVGTDSEGREVWLWDGGPLGADMPQYIIFNNQGYPQTADLPFENGGYYNMYAVLGNVIISTGIKSITPTISQGEGTWYSLDGRRVTTPTKGVYIQNGRKVIVR